MSEDPGGQGVRGLGQHFDLVVDVSVYDQFIYPFDSSVLDYMAVVIGLSESTGLYVRIGDA